MRQVLSSSNVPSINTTYYFPVAGGQATLSLDGNSFHPWSVAGKFKNLRVILDPAPGAGTSRTFTLMVNGVATALTVTISDSGTVQTDDVNEVTVAAGDYLHLRHTISGAPIGTTIHYSTVFEATDATKSGWAHHCPNTMPSATLDTYFSLFSMGSSTPSTTGTANAKEIAPCDMVIDRWDIRFGNAPPGSGNTWTFVIYKNDVAQDGTGGTPNTTLAITGTNRASSATFSLSISENDILYVKAIPTSSPQVALYPHVSVSITPAAGNIPIFSSCLNSSNTGWATGPNWTTNWFPSEKVNYGGYPIAFRLAKFKVILSTPPTSGNSLIFTLRKNGVTGLTVTISDTNITGSDDSNFIDVASSDNFGIRLVPVNSPPATMRTCWSAVMQAVSGVSAHSSVGFGAMLGGGGTSLSFG